MATWEFVLKYDDVNEMVEMFRIIITDLFNTFAPERTRTFRNSPSPWMTKTLRCMRDLRDRACERTKRTKADSAYKHYRDMRNYTYYYNNAAVLKEK